MIKIILYNNSSDNNLIKFITQNLCNFFTVTVFKNNSLISYGKGNEVFLAETDRISELKSDRTILVIDNNIKINKIKKISKGTISIVNSENEEQLRILSNLGATGITCGMSSKDIFTFSSLNPDRAVISLQRSIETLTNSPCEPFEIPVFLSGTIDSYHLLTYLGILTLIMSNDIMKQGNIIINKVI